ncbi:MAG: elongation factor 1-beta [Candidatus Bathyarchaeota archaeon]|nr:elongation factor 1-beta [Candidatus Bathyarchaeota archaeon]
MAEVIASIKIFPSEANTDLNKLKEKITQSLPSYASIYKFEDEPIAFGLVVIIAHITMPEEEGRMEEVEKNLTSIDEVSEIQAISVSRVSM